jgi:hypothetical protein
MQRQLQFQLKKNDIKASNAYIYTHYSNDLVTINLQHLTQALEKKTRHETSFITHIKKKYLSFHRPETSLPPSLPPSFFMV